jgi:hypothetical protein
MRLQRGLVKLLLRVFKHWFQYELMVYANELDS